MTAAKSLLKNQVAREESLTKLRDQLRLARQTGVARQQFTELFAAALQVLELETDQVARLFKISRPTVSRWTRGISAPHPLGQGPVFQVLEQKASEKLRTLKQ